MGGPHPPSFVHRSLNSNDWWRWKLENRKQNEKKKKDILYLGSKDRGCHMLCRL